MHLKKCFNRLLLSACAVIGLISCVPVSELNVSSVARYQKAMDLIDQGTLLLRSEKLDQARAAFEIANELGPYPAAIDGLGCVAFKYGRLDQAEKLFLDAHELDPSYTASLANLALLKDRIGRLDDAKELYIASLEENPENFGARNNFAGLLFDTKNESLAHLELLKAYTVSKHPIIRSNLERFENYEDESEIINSK